MSTGEQLTDVEVQVELQSDTDDAQSATAQGIGVGGTGGDHAQAEAAHQGIGLVGHGQQRAAQAGRHGAVGAGGQILFAQGLGHHRGLALALGVDAAHDALQGIELAHHAGHQVGLGQTARAASSALTLPWATFSASQRHRASRRRVFSPMVPRRPMKMT